MQHTICSYQILTKPKFSEQLFEYFNIHFHKIPSIGSREVARGQTEGRTNRRTDRER